VLLRAPAPRFSIQKRTKNARHSSTVGSDVARIPSSEVAVIITGKIVSQSVSQSLSTSTFSHTKVLLIPSHYSLGLIST
jgi:predicted nucleotidyltransferase